MKNSKVYCLINICSCFVRILKTYVFSTTMNRESVGYWYGSRLLYRCSGI